MRRTLVVSLAVLALAGCHLVRYDTGLPASQRVVTVPLNFYLWGLVGERVVDLDAACPEGAARWQNQATFGDAVIDVVTVGLWSPRTVKIECAEGRVR
ncbi:MAG: hypothetical protein WCC48_01110 [Anaeromyxobacteraceae bacterium]